MKYFLSIGICIATILFVEINHVEAQKSSWSLLLQSNKFLNQDFTTDELWMINPDTGSGKFIGNIWYNLQDLDLYITAWAVDTVGYRVFALTGNGQKIFPGLTRLIYIYDMVANVTTNITLNMPSGYPAVSFTELHYDSANDVLYSFAGWTYGTGYHPTWLTTINPATGNVTNVGAPISIANPQNQPGLKGSAFDMNNMLIYWYMELDENIIITSAINGSTLATITDIPNSYICLKFDPSLNKLFIFATNYSTYVNTIYSIDAQNHVPQEVCSFKTIGIFISENTGLDTYNTETSTMILSVGYDTSPSVMFLEVDVQTCDFATVNSGFYSNNEYQNPLDEMWILDFAKFPYNNQTLY